MDIHTKLGRLFEHVEKAVTWQQSQNQHLGVEDGVKETKKLAPQIKECIILMTSKMILMVWVLNFHR